MKTEAYYILRVLREEFELSPFQRAAKRLLILGVTSQQFLDFIKTAKGKTINNVVTNNTYNEMRTYELENKKGKT